MQFARTYEINVKNNNNNNKKKKQYNSRANYNY